MPCSKPWLADLEYLKIYCCKSFYLNAFYFYLNAFFCCFFFTPDALLFLFIKERKCFAVIDKNPDKVKK